MWRKVLAKAPLQARAAAAAGVTLVVMAATAYRFNLSRTIRLVITAVKARVVATVGH
jgi:hypothetical protein